MIILPPSPARPRPSMAGTRAGEERRVVDTVPAANRSAVPPDTTGKLTESEEN